MIMDEVVLDEVSLAGPGAPGQGGLPGQGNGMSANQNRAQKRQAEASPTQLGIKRAKKGMRWYTFRAFCDIYQKYWFHSLHSFQYN